VLKELRTFDVDRLSLEELVSLSFYAKGLRGEFDAKQVDQPEWLDDAMRRLQREIEMRKADSLEKRLKDIAAQKTGLETAAEKRARLAAEEDRIKAQLASVAR
jgi:hypothetical protein